MKNKFLVINIEWLKSAYFSDPAQRIRLKSGDVLLRQNQHNERLFLVIEGQLRGYLNYESTEPYEAFISLPDHFVGVYSFFSHTHQSYSTVIAETDCEVAYIEGDQADVEGNGFAEHFLPVVVEEIYMRQLLTQKMTIQNQKTTHKLFQAEKMATLGQLAAGLAHELNNAVGVIKRQGEHLAGWAQTLVHQVGDHSAQYLFRKGLEEGSSMSTADQRQRRRELEERFDLPSAVARQAAAAGLNDDDMNSLGKDAADKLELFLPYFEAGLAFHDLNHAADHASQVVRSVKELGVTNHSVRVPVNVAETLRQATVLLKEELKGVALEMKAEPAMMTEANPGEVVQIWVNLIKNACEALRESGRKKPTIVVNAVRDEKGMACVTIADNGPGIPPDLMPRIFQPDVTTKVEGLSFGLGLGLSIVQKIMDSLRGKISVESEPGHTIFTIRLPLAAKNPES
jgi:signal transduction histidine kinase